jgi:hypothetical protein
MNNAINARTLIYRENIAQLHRNAHAYNKRFPAHRKHRNQLYSTYIMKNYDGRLNSFGRLGEPHTKQKYRVHIMKQIAKNGTINSYDRNFNKRLRNIILNLKQGEFLPPGKAGRIVADPGGENTLLGSILMGIYKDAQAKCPIHMVVNGSTYSAYFVKKPSPKEIDKVFHSLMNPAADVVMHYHSDDSCMAMKNNGVHMMFNIDISKCDSTHETAVFKEIVHDMPDAYKHEAEECIKMTLLPLVIHGIPFSRMYKKYYKKHALKLPKVVLRPKKHTLTSGQVTTTAVNNVANERIGYAIAHALSLHKEPLKLEEMKALMIEAAATAGYEIKVEYAEIPEDLQFLKNSPVRDIHGKWRSLLNIGVALRSLGCAKREFPGSKDIPLLVRAAHFVACVIAGMWKDVHFPLADRLRELYPLPKKQSKALQKAVEEHLGYYHADRGANSGEFHAVDIYRRYRLRASQIESLDTQYGTPSTLYNGSAAARILEKDYGLTLKHESA